MRAVFISDTHNQHQQVILPKGDILFHGGDLSGRGSKTEIENFLLWFSSLPFKYKVFIAGNHDFFIQNEPQEFLNLLPSNCIYLQDEIVEIEGKKIYGSPWTPEFMHWAFMQKPGDAMKNKWRLIPENIDVLLTHGPAFGVLDKIFTGQSVGCKELHHAIEQIQPRYFLFGHIHEGYGQDQIGNTQFVNGSLLNEHYRLQNAPIVFDL